MSNIKVFTIVLLHLKQLTLSGRKVYMLLPVYNIEISLDVRLKEILYAVNIQLRNSLYET